jgi:hypothetical protein
MPWETGARTPAYDTAEYKRARLACLKAANWRCERRIAGVCIGAATQANHRGQLANDPHHRDLEAICVPCHKVVTAEQGGGYRRPKDPAPRPRTAW